MFVQNRTAGRVSPTASATSGDAAWFPLTPRLRKGLVRRRRGAVCAQGIRPRSAVVRHRGYARRRVILTERSEVDSESRRQPAIFIGPRLTPEHERSFVVVIGCQCYESAGAWCADTTGVLARR